jgi:uncharacterized membrane protein YoaK (UPF0700 family)
MNPCLVEVAMHSRQLGPAPSPPLALQGRSYARMALVLSAVAGFVDASAFTALHGLLPAHVTGLLIAASSEVVRPMGHRFSHCALALAFVGSVVGTVVVFRLLESRRLPPLPTLLGLLTLTLGGLTGLAAWLAPLVRDANGGAVFILSGAAVCAMGVQNTLMRLGLRASCPTTVMTGNLTQIIVQGANGWARKDNTCSAADAASQPAALALLGFVLGAVGGLVLTHSFGLVSCWLPAAASAGLTAVACREAAGGSSLTDSAPSQKSFALP